MPIGLLLGAALLFSGCLKTRITTDAAPSNEQAELMWAHGFVNGLVPPVNAPLDAEPVCGDAGVSSVYFRQTFVQFVAQGLTGSLYSPQHFTATCANVGGMGAAESGWWGSLHSPLLDISPAQDVPPVALTPTPQK
jgi:hypothetical protein